MPTPVGNSRRVSSRIEAHWLESGDTHAWMGSRGQLHPTAYPVLDDAPIENGQALLPSPFLMTLLVPEQHGGSGGRPCPSSGGHIDFGVLVAVGGDGVLTAALSS